MLVGEGGGREKGGGWGGGRRKGREWGGDKERGLFNPFISKYPTHRFLAFRYSRGWKASSKYLPSLRLVLDLVLPRTASGVSEGFMAVVLPLLIASRLFGGHRLQRKKMYNNT